MVAASRITKMARGSLILFEGVDRCGKTTQATKLVDDLCSTGKAVLMRFPDRETAIGKQINDYLANAKDLDDHVIHLLFSANRWEKRKEIVDLLQGGTHVVMDRYAMSGIAFSAAKPGMGFDWCAAPDAGLPAPDLILYMTLSGEEAAKRGGFGQERYEKAEFQNAVREQFLRVKAAMEGCSGSRWCDIDASGSIEGVSRRIREVTQDVTGKVATEPVRTLWEGKPMQ